MAVITADHILMLHCFCFSYHRYRLMHVCHTDWQLRPLLITVLQYFGLQIEYSDTNVSFIRGVSISHGIMGNVTGIGPIRLGFSPP